MDTPKLLPFDLIVCKQPDASYAKLNCVFVNTLFSNYVEIVCGQKKAIYRVKENKNIKSNEIALNLYQRTYLNVPLEKKVMINLVNDFDNKIINNITFLAKPIKKTLFEINDEVLQSIKDQYNDLFVVKNHEYSYENLISLNAIEMFGSSNNPIYSGLVTPDTKITIISPDKLITITTSEADKNLFKGEFDFQQMGIGGLDKQFEIVFRRAFSSRLIPDKVLKNLGINHVRGIMLYGPPGCGKTLIARQIGKILNCDEPKIVNGPSLLSSYIGRSEENVRELFSEAIADKNGKKLYLIICDEFDSLARRRGSGGPDSSVADKIVNQFLAMIDGPESLNNILLIAMTNRLDFIDEALLRPGRFEVQIEISLPDKKGRTEILNIHTKKMKDANYLNSDVNIDEIADLGRNFTGAELEGVVKNAVSYAMAKEFDPKNLSGLKNLNPNITHTDFLRAVKEIKPQFGSVSNEIDIMCSKEFILYSNAYKEVYDKVSEKISNLSGGKLLTLLIHGDHYIGKTTLACQIAKKSDINCVKFINSETLINSYNKDQLLYDIFNTCYKSESFCIILDSVEKIISYSKLGNAYDNKTLQVIYTILSKIMDTEKKGVILLTSSKSDLMDMLNIDEMCTDEYKLEDTYWPDTDGAVSTYFKDK
jgi:vesicle-fusing ATPase